MRLPRGHTPAKAGAQSPQVRHLDPGLRRGDGDGRAIAVQPSTPCSSPSSTSCAPRAFPASMKEHLTLLEALDADVIAASPEEFYFLARATFVKDEGLLDRFDQVFGKVFKGLETQLRHRRGAGPRGMAEEGRRALSHPRADGRDQVAGLVGRDHGGAEAAARGAAGAPPGRQQMDRHRRHLAVRQFGLQSRRRADRRRGRAGPRAQGLGQARVPQPRQQGRAGHAQHQGRAPPPAPLRPRGRRRGARPRRDDRRHRAQGLARHPRCGPSGTMR